MRWFISFSDQIWYSEQWARFCRFQGITWFQIPWFPPEVHHWLRYWVLRNSYQGALRGCPWGLHPNCGFHICSNKYPRIRNSTLLSSVHVTFWWHSFDHRVYGPPACSCRGFTRTHSAWNKRIDRKTGDSIKRENFLQVKNKKDETAQLSQIFPNTQRIWIQFRWVMGLDTLKFCKNG